MVVVHSDSRTGNADNVDNVGIASFGIDSVPENEDEKAIEAKTTEADEAAVDAGGVWIGGRTKGTARGNGSMGSQGTTRTLPSATRRLGN